MTHPRGTLKMSHFKTEEIQMKQTKKGLHYIFLCKADGEMK